MAAITRRVYYIALLTAFVAVVRSKSTMMQASCPDILYDTGNCTVSCDSDFDCSAAEKCCSYGCGRWCMQFISEFKKPGFCPPLPPGTIGICVELCSNDFDCPGEEKCCSTGCGHVCKKPCYTLSCSLTCPYGFKESEDGCSMCECTQPCDLVSCDDDTTCHPSDCDSPPCDPPGVCISIEEPYIPKPGLCPAPLPGVPGICVEMCGRDDQCPGEEKCCSNGCGHVCMKPVPIITPIGECPAVPEGIVGTCVEQCSDDGDCSDGQKCCSNGCGHVCVTPCLSLDCPRTCPYGMKYGDDGCPICDCVQPCDKVKCDDDKFCQPSDCDNPPCNPPAICIAPLPSEKPGECPEIPEGTMGTCVELCTDDFDCPKDEKCCSNGCGHVCMEPCKTLDCSKTCPYGFKVDDNNCKLCQCVEPCDLVTCDEDKICKPSECDNPPCNPPGVCVDPCTLPVKPGPCKGAFRRYYFDMQELICKPFIYGGCQGNANNFKTLEECNDACFGRFCPKLDCDLKCKLKKDEKTGCSLCECEDPCELKECKEGQVCVSEPSDCKTPPCPLVAKCVDICLLPKKTGPCKGSFKRYYFDKKELICKPFIYGGCQGNANNFKTLEECNDACFGRFCPKLDCDLKCKLKKDEKTGCSLCECEDPCELKECKEGEVCVSEPSDCKTPPCPLVAKCVDICLLPKKTGPCRGSFKRYYFDKKELVCKEFIYGGCQGNANNFKTLEECNDACFGKYCPDIKCTLECKLKKDEKTGCSICQCADPCEGVTCPGGQTCTALKVGCNSPPCEPKTMCLAFPDF